MALPKINGTPKYNMVVPSTQQAVRFRPFLVKEEKVLMIAMESNDNIQMLNAIVDTLDACIENGINKESLATFDVEYMFTKLRSKSVGETSTVGVNCEECKEQNEVKIDLDSLVMKVPKLDTFLEIDENISIEMKWPSFLDLVKIVPESSNTTDQVFSILRSCLSAIHTGDERIDLNDETAEEIQEFIESMNREQFDKLQKFVESMPALSHDVKFECVECKHNNNIKLQGMQSFF